MEIQWSLVLFTAISGVGGFLFVFTCIDELRKHELGNALYVNLIVALAFMAVGGIASMTHIIHHLDRVMAVLTHPAQGIFLEALMLGITGILAIVYGVLCYRQINATARRVVAVLGIVSAVLLSFFCGYSYMMGSRPSWDVVLLPLGYTGTVVAGGAGLHLFIAAHFKCADELLKASALYVIVGGALALVTGCAFGFYSGTAFGSAAWIFWVFVVLINGIVPVACGYKAMKDSASVVPAALLASMGGIIGSSGYRVFMWVVGTAVANYFGLAI